ncbi:MAG: Ig-like domain-containing protein [Nitrospirota bacterium]
MMYMIGRIRFIGLGIVLVGCLGGALVFAAEKPTEDGQKVMITSPKNGDKVSDSFELKYQATKNEQVGHVHVFVDNEYQRGFHGMVKGMSKGEHQITVKTTSKDHSSVTASHTITVDVP